MSGERETRDEKTLHGLAISPGIAIGPAFVTEDSHIVVPEYRIDPDGVAAEVERFRGAVQLSLKQLRKLKGKSSGLPGAAAEEMGYLLDAHLHMLADSRLVLLNNCGHWPPFEKPAEWTAQVLAFLRGY